jgi:tRNA(fMet)-specific endonuclease VapC
MLDTDITSYLIKGRHKKMEAHFKTLPPASVCISSITQAELTYGLKKLPGNHRLQIDVPFFLKRLRVLCWDAKAADNLAQIRYSLETTGQIIGMADMMIASHAIAAEAVLVTNNTRHYTRIPLPLVLENWAAS